MNKQCENHSQAGNSRIYSSEDNQFWFDSDVGFGAVVWLNPKFGLFALILLFLVVPPLYAMNRGVLKLTPVMERAMKKSQKKLARVFSGEKNTETCLMSAEISQNHYE